MCSHRRFTLRYGALLIAPVFTVMAWFLLVFFVQHNMSSAVTSLAGSVYAAQQAGILSVSTVGDVVSTAMVGSPLSIVLFA